MDDAEDPLELERKIAQASCISSRMTDQTTYERLRAWVEELRQRLGLRLAARRMREEIRARVRQPQGQLTPIAILVPFDKSEIAEGSSRICRSQRRRNSRATSSETSCCRA